MSFLAQAKMADDNYLIERIAACAALQGVAEPRTWAVNRMWRLCATPGWAAAYAQRFNATELLADPAGYAPKIGADEAVITDSMIAAAVKAVLGEDEQQAPPVVDAAE